MPLDIFSLTKRQISGLSNAELKAVAAQVLHLQREDSKENQILYYQPAHQEARQAHLSSAHTIACFGGNRSSKTETMLVEMVALATGIFPQDEEIAAAFAKKFRGPVNQRVVIQSMKSHLHPVILPKFRWYTWNGLKPQGGAKGHWGWVPKMCLKDGDWDRAWSEKLTTLTVLCRNPENWEEVLGESMIQFMSLDMDLETFCSGTFDDILHDEPPHHDIWRENKMRVMDNNGRMRLSMTWPDDPAVTVDWIYDEVYEPKDPEIAVFTFDTRRNRHLDQAVVERDLERMDEQTRKVRIEGGSLRLSNLVHPFFTDHSKHWCFSCGKSVVPDGRACPACGNEDVVEFNHVGEWETGEFWPSVFLLDPHPRKPHMYLWVRVDPQDDYWVVAEGELDGDPVEVAREVFDVEERFGLDPAWRIMDPNMGATVSSTKREVTWQDEFRRAGLWCDLGDDSGTGRQKLNLYMKPDHDTYMPRFRVHSRCCSTIHQLKRYRWDDYRRVADRGQKQTPKDKEDDFPTLLKYLMNAEPTFQFLRGHGRVIGRPGKRVGAY